MVLNYTNANVNEELTTFPLNVSALESLTFAAIANFSMFYNDEFGIRVGGDDWDLESQVS